MKQTVHEDGPTFKSIANQSFQHGAPIDGRRVVREKAYRKAEALLTRQQGVMSTVGAATNATHVCNTCTTYKQHMRHMCATHATHVCNIATRVCNRHMQHVYATYAAFVEEWEGMRPTP